MFAKNFDCNKCIKEKVCKYSELMNKCYTNMLNNYEEEYNHDYNTIPVISLVFKCSEYSDMSLTFLTK